MRDAVHQEFKYLWRFPLLRELALCIVTMWPIISLLTKFFLIILFRDYENYVGFGTRSFIFDKKKKVSQQKIQIHCFTF